MLNVTEMKLDLFVQREKLYLHPLTLLFLLLVVKLQFMISSMP